MVEVDPCRRATQDAQARAFALRPRIPRGLLALFVVALLLPVGTLPGHAATAQNTAPYWDPHHDVTTTHSQPWMTYVQAHDPDGDPLTLHATLPSGAILTDLGNGQGRIEWTPGTAQLGDHTLTIFATDGNATAALSFEVRVVTNKAPVFSFVTPNNPLVCVKGPWWSGVVNFSASATDPEGTPVTYLWRFHHDGSTTSGPTATYTYAQPGGHLVSVTATDAHGVQATRFTTIRVDECVRTTLTLENGCLSPLEENQGRIRMWDHTGAPTDGTYSVTIRWDTTTGLLPVSRTLTGTITNGIGDFTIPQDHQILLVGFNEPGDHRVQATGFRPSLFGGSSWDNDSARYQVEARC